MLNENLLILVCNTESQGQYLALLLSNHLVLSVSEAHDSYTPHQNAFSNHQIHLFFNKRAEDVSLAQWQLLIDEGLDTEKLIGCILNYGHLGLFKNSTGIASYRWIFIPETEAEITQIQAFFIRHKLTEFRILPTAWLSVAPKTILKQLSNWLHLEMVRTEEIEPNPIWHSKSPLCIPNDLLNQITIQQTVPIRILTTVSNQHEINQLQEVEERLQCLGFTDVQWHIKFNSAVYELIRNERCTLPEHIVMKDEYETLERLAKESRLIYLDLKFTIPANYWEDLLLNPGKHTLLTGCLSNTPENKIIVWKDLLAGLHVAGACCFSLMEYHEVGGLDKQLPIRLQWTDLIIRILALSKNQSGFSIPVRANQDIELETIAFNDYQILIKKHRRLIEEHVEEILHDLGTQHVDQDEMLLKLNRLNQMLVHSQDELSTLKQFSDQLQHRIRQLESSRYIRLKKAIGKYKKLFFRKKTPGHRPIQRLISFLRFLISQTGGKVLRTGTKKIAKKIYLQLEDRPMRIIYLDEDKGQPVYSYDQWIKTKLTRAKEFKGYDALNKPNASRPLLSIIMPVYNTPLKYLKEAIESVLAQGYSNWELCIADDHSNQTKVFQLLRAYRVKDPRIKVHYRSENGHISKTSNDALALAEGEFVVLMDHDDLLAGNALEEIVLALQKHPQTDLLYSDEDKIDERGIHSVAHFKPDWCPDHLLSRNYIGHVVVLRRSLVHEVGGFRTGFEGSQDYDLLLRITERTNRIVHIPKVLYHWRIHQLSTAQGEDVKPYAYMAAKRALEEACLRRGMQVNVKYLQGLRGYRISYPLSEQPLVSIVIPSKDQHELLKNTIDSLVKKTQYPFYEIILLNNNSKSANFFKVIEDYKKALGSKFRCIDCPIPFNFSRLMNIGRSNANGELLLFLNNDVEIIQTNWLEQMVSMAIQKRIGAVGVKLLYPDDTIQHAGVIIGLGGVAGHAFTGIHKDEPGYFNYIQSTNNFSALTAACLMLRTEVYDAVDGMDEQFEVEYNDVDLCLKVREKGYFNVYLPHVELYHFESATRGHPHQSKSGYERHLKEMALFKKKWPEYIKNDPCYNPNLNLGVHDFGMNFLA